MYYNEAPHGSLFCFEQRMYVFSARVSLVLITAGDSE